MAEIRARFRVRAPELGRSRTPTSVGRRDGQSHDPSLRSDGRRDSRDQEEIGAIPPLWSYLRPDRCDQKRTHDPEATDDQCAEDQQLENGTRKVWRPVGVHSLRLHTVSRGGRAPAARAGRAPAGRARRTGACGRACDTVVAFAALFGPPAGAATIRAAGHPQVHRAAPDLRLRQLRRDLQMLQ